MNTDRTVKRPPQMPTPVIVIISYFIPKNFIHPVYTQDTNFRILLVKDPD